jgi:uncharacterized protein (TIGR02453 family)
MENTINLGPALSFLDELNKNNNKAWFDSHRPAYENARQAFERLIDTLIDELRVPDKLEGLTARDCIFRINRDLRFTKDKTPYKINLAAVVGPGGRKAFVKGYYISIEPHGQSMVAGGLYSPTAEQLARFRQAIDRYAPRYKKVIQDRTFVDYFGTVGGETLKTAPQGYDREHPEIELLKLKQVTAMHSFSDREVMAPGFSDQLVSACRIMRPFLDYLDGILE